MSKLERSESDTDQDDFSVTGKTGKNGGKLFAIPDKKYFTIGEAANICDVKPHVLRYWEQEFDQLKPTKRRGNRRYYQRQDLLTVQSIRSLLYEQGFTIGGARQKMANGSATADEGQYKEVVQQMISELTDILKTLES